MANLTIDGEFRGISLVDLTSEQRALVIGFSTREELIEAFEAHGCLWRECDVVPTITLRTTIKARDLLRHNPNKGAIVYGATKADVENVYRLLGDDLSVRHTGDFVKLEAFDETVCDTVAA